MIADTTFLSDFYHERERDRRGPASAFLLSHRSSRILVTVISLGEIAAIFETGPGARQFLGHFRVLALTSEVALSAAQIDREQISSGARLGENDTWIAGFCRYYGQPLISRDAAFDRVKGLRRLRY